MTVSSTCVPDRAADLDQPARIESPQQPLRTDAIVEGGVHVVPEQVQLPLEEGVVYDNWQRDRDIVCQTLLTVRAIRPCDIQPITAPAPAPSS